MSDNGIKTQAMRWVVLIVSSCMFVGSTTVRLFEGKEADSGVCWVFLSVSGLIFGAKLIDTFKK